MPAEMDEGKRGGARFLGCGGGRTKPSGPTLRVIGARRPRPGKPAGIRVVVKVAGTASESRIQRSHARSAGPGGAARAQSPARGLDPCICRQGRLGRPTAGALRAAVPDRVTVFRLGSGRDGPDARARPESESRMAARRTGPVLRGPTRATRVSKRLGWPEGRAQLERDACDLKHRGAGPGRPPLGIDRPFQRAGRPRGLGARPAEDAPGSDSEEAAGSAREVSAPGAAGARLEP
jgi:hypothetical protein